MMRWRFALLIAGLALLGVSRELAAQETAGDTAAVLVQAARELEAQGHGDAARELLRFVVGRYPGTAAASEARALLDRSRAAPQARDGRSHFVLWSTLFGSWLGVVTPAAFGADDPTPYGVGLLIGAPTGLFGSLAYTRGRPITAGQAGLYSLSTLWGTWQAMGWRAVLDIGAQETCDPFGGCFTSTPEEAPWAAALVGGVAGVVAGVALTRLDVTDGAATLVRHASVWGTGLGLGFGLAAHQEDDALLTWVLVAGNVALLAAIPGGSAWQPSDTDVRLASVGGVAGAAAGVGVGLLVDPEDGDDFVLFPTIGAAVGLIAGSALVTTRRHRMGSGASEDALPGDALLSVRGRARLNVPLPQPGARWTLGVDGRLRRQPTLEWRLLEVRF